MNRAELLQMLKEKRRKPYRGPWFYAGLALWLLIGCLVLGLVCVAGSFPVRFQSTPPPASPAWSFVEISDLHAGSALSLQFSNTVNTIIDKKDLWNVKLVVTAGDCYEQNTNQYPWTTDGGFMCGQSMTNQLWRLKNAGISVFPVPGNHDSDNTNQTTIMLWNTVFGTNFFAGDTNFYASMVTNDTRNVALKFSVGSCNMLFVGIGWLDNYASSNTANLPSFVNTNQTIVAYSNAVYWASNLAVQFPSHHVIPVTHYFVGTNGQPGFKDLAASPDVPDVNSPSASGQYVCEGPGLSLWNALKSAPNVTAFLCGHVRQVTQVASLLTCDDGHQVAAVKFDSQTGFSGDSNVNANNGAVFSVYTVYPALNKVMVKNYGMVYVNALGTYTNRFLGYGEFSIGTKNLSNDWYFPFRKL